jgi:hypothetical protein
VHDCEAQAQPRANAELVFGVIVGAGVYSVIGSAAGMAQHKKNLARRLSGGGSHVPFNSFACFNGIALVIDNGSARRPDHIT